MPILDYRSLALFRIVLGVALLHNLIFYRFAGVGFFYGEDSAVDYTLGDAYFGAGSSFFQYLSSETGFLIFFGLMFVMTVLFTIGYRTKIITPLLFFTYGSIFVLNPYLAHGVEFMLEVALFWAIFLPLDQVWSVSRLESSTVVTCHPLVSLCVLIQLFLIYASSWIYKDGDIWKSGMVMQTVAYDLIHARDLLIWLSNYPVFLKIMTYIGFYIEICISIGLLLSVRFSKIRIITAVLLFMLHSMMALLLHVGSFFPVGLAFAIILLPSSVFQTKRFQGLRFYSNPRITTAQSISRGSQVLLILVIAFIARNNLHFWSKNSYVDNLLTSLPLHRYTLGWHFSDPGIFPGLWHQAWKFFPNNLYTDLGDFQYLGIDREGNYIDLNNGNPLDPIITKEGVINYSPISYNDYYGAEFTFAVYLKFYPDRFPDSVRARWLELRYKRFEENFPETSIDKIEMHKIKRSVRFEKDQVKVSDSTFLLVSKSIKSKK